MEINRQTNFLNLFSIYFSWWNFNLINEENFPSIENGETRLMENYSYLKPHQNTSQDEYLDRLNSIWGKVHKLPFNQIRPSYQFSSFINKNNISFKKQQQHQQQHQQRPNHEQINLNRVYEFPLPNNFDSESQFAFSSTPEQQIKTTNNKLPNINSNNKKLQLQNVNNPTMDFLFSTCYRKRQFLHRDFCSCWNFFSFSDAHAANRYTTVANSTARNKFQIMNCSRKLNDID